MDRFNSGVEYQYREHFDKTVWKIFKVEVLKNPLSLSEKSIATIIPFLFFDLPGICRYDVSKQKSGMHYMFNYKGNTWHH